MTNSNLAQQKKLSEPKFRTIELNMVLKNIKNIERDNVAKSSKQSYMLLEFQKERRNNSMDNYLNKY